MFKLVKILSSGPNVPEPIRVRHNSNDEVTRGCIYHLDSDYVSADSYENGPLVLSLQNIEYDSDIDTLLCYLITSDMIFEATVKNKPESVTIGQKFCIAKNNYSQPCLVSTTLSDDEANGIIIDNFDYNRTGKVLVKFFEKDGYNQQ